MTTSIPTVIGRYLLVVYIVQAVTGLAIGFSLPFLHLFGVI